MNCQLFKIKIGSACKMEVQPQQARVLANLMMLESSSPKWLMGSEWKYCCMWGQWRGSEHSNFPIHGLCNCFNYYEHFSRVRFAPKSLLLSVYLMVLVVKIHINCTLISKVEGLDYHNECVCYALRDICGICHFVEQSNIKNTCTERGLVAGRYFDIEKY